MGRKVVNDLDHGGDPAGVNESTVAFREALRLSRRIEVPRGVYLVWTHRVWSQIGRRDVRGSRQENRFEVIASSVDPFPDGGLTDTTDGTDSRGGGSRGGADRIEKRKDFADPD